MSILSPHRKIITEALVTTKTINQVLKNQGNVLTFSLEDDLFIRTLFKLLEMVNTVCGLGYNARTIDISKGKFIRLLESELLIITPYENMPAVQIKRQLMAYNNQIPTMYYEWLLSGIYLDENANNKVDLIDTQKCFYKHYYNKEAEQISFLPIELLCLDKQHYVTLNKEIFKPRTNTNNIVI